MRVFIEKLFIALFCLFNTYMLDKTRDLVLFFLLSISISLVLDLLNLIKIKISIYILFLGLCFFNNTFIYYLPLILYNVYLDFHIYSLLITPLLIINFSLLNLFIAASSIYLSFRTKQFNLFISENKLVRDKLKEDTIYLAKYNEQLKIDREKNIHIAILTERNRIAREMHDSIGHSISSSILQVEALKVSSSEDSKESLNLLQNTLSNGMNDIRNSIHNLYNESLDLKKRIEEICSQTSSLNIQLNYNLEDDLTYDFKFDILSIVRESITNCVKHSNATELNISILTQPKFYSIRIKDNGSSFKRTSDLMSQGIGLLSMDEIARKHKGFLNYEFDNGFKIYITLMKG